MATIKQRTYKSWRVSVPDHPELGKAHQSKPAADDHVATLKALGHAVHVKAHTSVSYCVRIRSDLAPHLNKTFPTKVMAQEWAKEKEGEIVKRQFVDYREADRHTLGDLLQRFDSERLAHLDRNDPDRARIGKLCRHPLTLIRMSTIQPADFAKFRDMRLAGGFVEPKKVNGNTVEWAPIKGTSVSRELDLMSSVITVARKEWKIHIPRNPASAQFVQRPDKVEGDERDRRLATNYLLGDKSKPMASSVSVRKKRMKKDVDYELDPFMDELLKMDQTEQQALLRAARYPEWHRPQKQNVTVNTVLARARTKARKPLIKARHRQTGGLWAVISFAIETAMRRGEMVKLEWSHVHFGHENGHLDLPGRITKNKKPRIVPLSLRACRILKSRSKVSNFVFNTTQNTLKMGFRRARERVSSDDLRMHDLRHEATSRFFEQTTLRTEEVGSITGHTDPRMLARYYNKRPEEFVTRVANSWKSKNK